jgi:hypothetical protein
VSASVGAVERGVVMSSEVLLEASHARARALKAAAFRPAPELRSPPQSGNELRQTRVTLG